MILGGWILGLLDLVIYPSFVSMGFWITKKRHSGIVGLGTGSDLAFRLSSVNGFSVLSHALYKDDYETASASINASIQPCGGKGCVSKRSQPMDVQSRFLE